MAEAFNSLGNHIVSDSAAAINAGGDDVSAVDATDTILHAESHAASRPRRRRADDDEATDVYDDDDMESLISQPVNGAQKQDARPEEDEVELPPHACA